jgi:hypothetical protein
MKKSKSTVIEKHPIATRDLDVLALKRARFEKDLDAFIDAVDRLEKYSLGAIEATDRYYEGYSVHVYRLMSARRRLAEVLENLPDLRWR